MTNPRGPERGNIDVAAIERTVATAVETLRAPIRPSTQRALHNLWNRISNLPAVQKIGFTELTGRDLDLYVLTDQEDIRGNERIHRDELNYNRRTRRDLPVMIHIVPTDKVGAENVPTLAHVVFDRNEQANQSTLP